MKKSLEAKAHKTRLNSEENRIILPERKKAKTSHKVWLGLGIVAVIVLGSLLAINIVYANKLFPGTWGNGVYLGGMTKNQALDSLNKKTNAYLKSPLVVTSESNSWQIDPQKINIVFQNQQLIDDLFYSTHSNLITQIMTILGLNKRNYEIKFDSDKLSEYLIPINDAVSTPVSDAAFGLTSTNQLVIDPSIKGSRIDTSGFLKMLEENIGLTSSAPVRVPIYKLSPAVSENELNSFESQVKNYLSSPLTLVYASKEFAVKPKQILSWVKIKSSEPTIIKKPNPLSVFLQKEVNFSSGLNSESIVNYLTSISDQINQSPQDARLSFGSEGLRIVSPSRDGRTLNLEQSAQEIIKTLGEDSQSTERRVKLAVEIKKPEVREDNLATLGINELISEGVTYFPGSPPNRIQNIKVGAAKFNSVLLKPGEVFSFGKILGDVGPEQGYTPGLVILQNHEEKQYGGGLCQVSSTAYRAALLAGLPILERHNHAFAVSYYTAPYGVPGVDATIYYPQVDLKFKNDTGGYILIQTTLAGTTLKFDYYGTKTKSGVIRGPEFVTGSNDVNQPSHTVFYRDVVSGNGQVVKTDAVNTYYRPATDFPISGD